MPYQDPSQQFMSGMPPVNNLSQPMGGGAFAGMPQTGMPPPTAGMPALGAGSQPRGAPQAGGAFDQGRNAIAQSLMQQPMQAPFPQPFPQSSMQQPMSGFAQQMPTY